MPYAGNPHGCMPDVLNFITEIDRFYAKYHLLDGERREATHNDLTALHRRMTRTCVVIQHDVESVTRRLQAITAHFNTWMAEPVHNNRKWVLHPSEDFKLLISKGKVVLAHMEHEILTHQVVGCPGSHA